MAILKLPSERCNDQRISGHQYLLYTIAGPDSLVFHTTAIGHFRKKFDRRQNRKYPCFYMVKCPVTRLG